MFSKTSFLKLCNYIYTRVGRRSVIPVPFDRTVGPVKHGMSDHRPGPHLYLHLYLYLAPHTPMDYKTNEKLKFAGMPRKLWKSGALEPN